MVSVHADLDYVYQERHAQMGSVPVARPVLLVVPLQMLVQMASACAVPAQHAKQERHASGVLVTQRPTARMLRSNPDRPSTSILRAALGTIVL